MPTMNASTPHAALRLHDDGHQRILNLLDALQSGRLRIVDRPSLNSNTVFCPRMEVFDDPAAPTVVATFELPGVKSADLSIGVKDDVLVVRGQRACRHAYGRRLPVNRRHPSLRGLAQANDADADQEDHDAQALARRAEYTKLFPWRELRYGYFRRSVRLPRGVNGSCITATLADGLLVVRWPRASRSGCVAKSDTEKEEDSDIPACMGTHPQTCADPNSGSHSDNKFP
ncbi:hypothetical protein GGX14DRAFT_587584 [Mycena pura]|uniref:SHSP domain-containing protein n=1 Tax=Mycena pura TaxID=153505 RepID=A0AAD6USZ0_9AGAR|nr:hypothetical protein GGX14DRAFT_587584 [Mycena pura]